MKQSFMQRVLPCLGILAMHATLAYSAVNITADPVNTILTDGTTLTLQVTASSTSTPANPLLYQWFKQNGAAWDAVTLRSSSDKYVVTKVTNAAVGVYRAEVYETTTADLQVSNTATVSILTRPRITVQPAAPLTLKRDGDSVDFTVTVDASGTPNFTYTWQKRVGAAYVDLGAPVTKPDTTDTFTLPAITMADAGSYRVKVSNPSSVVAISKDVLLKLNSRPMITSAHAGSLNVVFGASGILKVVAAGNAPMTYEWLKNNVPIAKSNRSSLTIKGNDNLADGVAEGPGLYRVRITNSYTPVDSVGDPPVLVPQYTESVAAAVRVIRKPRIATQPEKKKDISIVGAPAAHGISVVMDATGNDVGTFTFQWFKDNKPYAGPGALTNTINFASVNWQDRGSYKVVIKNEVGSVTSTPGVLNVISPPLVLSQTIGPVFGATKGSAKILVVGGGTAPLKYEWFFKPVDPDPMDADVPDYGAIPVGKASTLSISGLKSTNTGEYKCIVTSTAKPSNGSVESLPIRLQVDVAPKILTQTKIDGVDTTSTNINVATPKKLHLLVAVTPDTTNRPADTLDDLANPLTFQWQKDNVNLAGQTTADLLIDPVAIADSGKYRCVIANKSGTVTSLPLTIVASGPPTVLVEPTAAVTGIVEDKIETPVGVTAIGKAPFKYQWQIRSGTVGSYSWMDVPGKTTTKLTFAQSKITDDGIYRCRVKDQIGEVYSRDVQISVTGIPAAVIGPVAGKSTVEFYPQVARASEKVRLFGSNLKYTSAVNFDLSPAAFVIESDNSLLLTVPATAGTSAHSIKVTTNGKIAGSPGGLVTSSTLQFTRTTDYGNNWIVASGKATNATILPGTGLTTIDGDNRFAQTQDINASVFYFIKVPKLSYLNITCVGGAVGGSEFDLGLAVYLQNGGGFKGPDGVTGFPGSTPTGAYQGVPTQLSNYYGYSTEYVTVSTTSVDQHVLIEVFRPYFTPTTMVGYGPFTLTVGITPFATSSETASAESSQVQAVVAAAGTAMTPGSWSASDGGAMELLSNDGAAQEIRFGGGNPDGGNAVQLWNDETSSADGSASMTATFNMSLEAGGDGGDDQFSWQLNGHGGLSLGALWVDTSTGAIRLVEPDGTVHQSIQRMTPGGGAHRFEISVDSLSSAWSVTMDGVSVTEPVPLPQGARYGEVYGVWDNGGDAEPSGASIIFSGFRISEGLTR